MKKIVYTIIITILICLVPVKSYCQKTCINNFTNIAKAYLNHATKKYKLDTTAFVFVASITESENGYFFYELTFVDTLFLTNYKYDTIYALDKFKLVIPKDFDKSGRLAKVFKKLPFEDLNKSKKLPEFNYSENFQRWYFYMNSRCEIIQVNGLPPRKKFIQNMKKYKLVFAKDIPIWD